MTHVIHSERPYGCNSCKSHSFFYWKVPLPKELNNTICQRVPQITFLFANSCCYYYCQCQQNTGKNTLCHNDHYSEPSGNLNCPRRTLPLGTTFSRRQKWCALWELCKMKKFWILYIQFHMCSGGDGWLGRCLSRLQRNSEINIKRKDSTTWTILKLQSPAAWWGNENWPQSSLCL